MPNWNFNELKIAGETQAIDKLIKMVRGKDEKGEVIPLSFNSIIPMPKELFDTPAPVRGEKAEAQAKNNVKKYGYPNWYEFALAEWGTKWDLDDEVDFDIKGNGADSEATFKFDTAWTPPIPFVKKLSELFPTLSFELRYVEPGEGFGGIYTADSDGDNDDECRFNKNAKSYTRMLKYFGMEEFAEQNA